ncbi:G1 S regulator protein [Rutstroemia sp. NJR-2017a BBW]|nr:G1 S regulator protein [Rutstroemia sp. NJR-2017a BBW]
MLDSHSQVLRTPPRQTTAQLSAEGRVLTRKSTTAQPSHYEGKSATVRERGYQHYVTKAERVPEENLESIRQWQKHYRKNFPKFVFYFESIPEDVRLKYTRQVLALGAREVKFFSNEVTHVVTTRSIPAEVPQSSNTANSSTTNEQNGTINPSLLDRSSETADSRDPRSKFTFEAPIPRRLGTSDANGDVRRQQVRSLDVLYKARELGIKIWALEKLQRMLTTMFDTETGYQSTHSHNTRSHSTQGSTISRAFTILMRNRSLSWYGNMQKLLTKKTETGLNSGVLQMASAHSLKKSSIAGEKRKRRRK